MIIAVFCVILPRMLTKTQAIVLHAFKYGESRLIVDLFTRQAGRLSFIVSLPKSAKATSKKQFFQPLTILELEFDLRPKAQLQKMGDVHLSYPYSSIPFEPSKISISLFLAEFLYHALKGEQQNPNLYDYIRYSLEWLDNSTSSYANFHLVFLMHMSKFLGFYPNLEEREERKEAGGEDAFFDLREGRFCLDAPLHRDFLAANEASKIALLMRMTYPTMHLFRMSHTDRQRLLEVALLYYRLHLPDFPELKSVAVLQELYQS